MRLWSRAAIVTLGVTVVTLTACARERSGEVHEGAAGSDAVEVVVQDDAFVPDDLSLKAGTGVDVEVRNEGSGGHNFTIDALDLSTGTVEPGRWSRRPSPSRTGRRSTTARSIRACAARSSPGEVIAGTD